MQVEFDSSGLDKFKKELDQSAIPPNGKANSKSDAFFLIGSGLLMAGLIFLTWYIASKTNYNPTVASTAITTVAVILIGFVAAYMGARATLRATQRAHENNLLLQKQNHEANIRGVVQAIYAELSCLWEIYRAEFGEQWDNFKSGDAFETFYPLNQDYFTVFNSNSVFIGQIPDDNLRTAIVKAYLRAKGLIDSHLLNNKLIDEHARLQNAMSLGTDPLQEKIVRDAFDNLKRYGNGIHSAYGDARTSVLEALYLMEQSVMIETKTAFVERASKTEFRSL